MKLVRYIALLGIVLFQCVLADDSLDADVASANEKVEAAYRLGELYRADTEIGPDLREAALHYYVAANGGHSLAQQKLAKMYYFGNGVSEDHGRAAKYMQMSANQDAPEAQHWMGRMYLHGDGVKQDYAVALANFSAASSNGHLEANLSIGDMYALGLGVEKNLHEAFKWYDQAAQQATSRDYIAFAKKSRDAVAKVAGIKIEPKIVPMEGSGQLVLHEGQLIEYDPILSDLPVHEAAPVHEASPVHEAGPVRYMDWWKGQKPKLTYNYASPSKNRRKQQTRPTERNTFNDGFNFGSTPDFNFGSTPDFNFGSRKNRPRKNRPRKVYPSIGNRPAINPATGKVYLKIGGGIAIDPATGKVYPMIGGGLAIDTATGKVYPTIP